MKKLILIALLATATAASAIQRVPLWQTSFPSNIIYYAIQPNSDDGETVCIDLDHWIETNALAIAAITNDYGPRITFLETNLTDRVSTNEINIAINASNILDNASNILDNTSSISNYISKTLTTNLTLYIAESTPNTTDRSAYIYSLMDAYTSVDTSVTLTFEFGPGTFYLSTPLIFSNLAPNSGCAIIVKGAVSGGDSASILYFYTGSDGVYTEDVSLPYNYQGGNAGTYTVNSHSINRFVLAGGLVISGLAGSNQSSFYGIIARGGSLMLYAPLEVMGFSHACIAASDTSRIYIKPWVMDSNPIAYKTITMYADDASDSCDGLLAQNMGFIHVSGDPDKIISAVDFKENGNGAFDYHLYAYRQGHLSTYDILLGHLGNASVTDSGFWTISDSFGLLVTDDLSQSLLTGDASTTMGITF
jgi:hypothetical protein